MVFFFFSDYVREEVLEPLGLRRTMLLRADIKNEDNIAYPHSQLSDGSFTKFESQQLPHACSSRHRD